MLLPMNFGTNDRPSTQSKALTDEALYVENSGFGGLGFLSHRTNGTSRHDGLGYGV